MLRYGKVGLNVPLNTLCHFGDDLPRQSIDCVKIKSQPTLKTKT